MSLNPYCFLLSFLLFLVCWLKLSLQTDGRIRIGELNSAKYCSVHLARPDPDPQHCSKRQALLGSPKHCLLGWSDLEEEKRGICAKLFRNQKSKISLFKDGFTLVEGPRKIFL